MAAFRALLVVFIVAIYGYTAWVGLHHGWNLMPVFFGAIAEGAWPGQFNLDFSCFLLLAGIWVAWRHQFSVGGVALGLVSAVGGIAVVAPYLLWASVRADGNPQELLLGPARARAS